MNVKHHETDSISFRVSAWLLRITGSQLRKHVLEGRLDPIWKNGKMTFHSKALEDYLFNQAGTRKAHFKETREYSEFHRRLQLWVKQTPIG